MKCPSCNKFAAYDTTADPEINGADAFCHAPCHVARARADLNNGLAAVSGQCRIVLTSHCCGDDLKEHTFDIEASDIDITRADGCECDLTELGAEGSADLTEKTEKKTTYYGAQMNITIACGCGKTTATTEWADNIEVSDMEELT